MEDRLNDWKLFFYELFNRFQQDKCSSVAAELTVTSLLALVPLTTLVFALLSVIPNFDDIALKLQQYLFNYFIPVSGESIQIYLIEFVSKAKSMSGVGFLMLFITALMMMRTIDKSFNHIWDIKRNQSRVRTFLVYWAVLTLGPVALGASILITSYINSLPFISESIIQDSFWFNTLLPFLMASIAFSVMYFVIPNKKILIVHAIFSGIVSALLFELAKSSFGVFIKYFSTYEIVFGALASIPLFLIWIYVSWNIVLFGAEFCYGLSDGTYKLKSNSHSGSINHEFRRLNALIMLIEAQNTGNTLSFDRAKKLDPTNLDFTLDDLTELVDEGIAIQSNDESFCLAGKSENLTYSSAFKNILNNIPNNNLLQQSQLNDKNKLDIQKISLLLEDFLDKKISN